MERRQSGIHGRKSLCSKQQEDQGRNPKGKSQLGRCGTFRTTKDVGITEKKLLVARTQRKHQEIHTRMLQVSTEQSSTLEETRRITSVGNSTRTMVGN